MCVYIHLQSTAECVYCCILLYSATAEGACLLLGVIFVVVRLMAYLTDAMTYRASCWSVSLASGTVDERQGGRDLA